VKIFGKFSFSEMLLLE